MNSKRTAATTGVIAAVLIGTTLITAPLASADELCGPGLTAVVTERHIEDPRTGEIVSGPIASCPDEAYRNANGVSDIISAITPSVGVDFRDDNGNRTSSGMSVLDQFEYLGEKKDGKDGDGALIKVKQITNGRGGWGSLYIGWIPVKYTQAPVMFG